MPDELPLAPPPPAPLVELLRARRTTRAFAAAPLARDELAGLLWAVQGRTDDDRRTCPSAHRLYPLELRVIAGAVTGLPAGVYAYDSGTHALRTVAEGDRRERVAEASLADREWLPTAPAILVLSADLVTVNEHFADQPPQGRRGARYAWLEAGHASQNGYLWAAEEGLAVALVGGFDDERLREVLPPAHDPLALIAVGHP